LLPPPPLPSPPPSPLPPPLPLASASASTAALAATTLCTSPPCSRRGRLCLLLLTGAATSCDGCDQACRELWLEPTRAQSRDLVPPAPPSAPPPSSCGRRLCRAQLVLGPRLQRPLLSPQARSPHRCCPRRHRGVTLSPPHPRARHPPRPAPVRQPAPARARPWPRHRLAMPLQEPAQEPVCSYQPTDWLVSAM